MAAPKFQVVFNDGHTDEVSVTPRIQVEIERKFGSPFPAIEAGYYGCWVGLGRPGKFDDWLDTVADVQPVSDGDESPTSPGASDGS